MYLFGFLHCNQIINLFILKPLNVFFQSYPNLCENIVHKILVLFLVCAV